MKRDLVYLVHIKQAMEKIVKYLNKRTKEEFMQDEILQDAVIRQLEIVGEATKRLSFELVLKHPEIPWKGMAGLRDVLIHAYAKVDLENIWRVSTQDVPDTLAKITDLIQLVEKEKRA